MRLHLAARVHAFVHGMFRPKDEVETHALWEQIARLYEAAGLETEADRTDLTTKSADRVLAVLGLRPADQLYAPMRSFILQLFDYEQQFVFPQLDWQTKRTTSEWWEIREVLSAERQWLTDVEATLADLEACLIGLLQPVVETVSRSPTGTAGQRSLQVSTVLLQGAEPSARIIEHMVVGVLSSDSLAAALWPRLAGQLDYNLAMASARNPLDAGMTSKQQILPTRSSLRDPNAMVDAYLGKTPFVELLKSETTLSIPEAVRFEHCHIIGGSGHGKSQTLQYLIAHDLPAVAAGERSIIVLDSQGDLIRNIGALAEFRPGGPLHDRVVIIDPSDVEWPVSLNLFDVGIDRLQGYEPLERERLTNSILELYDFVLGSLLSAEMTQKQNVIFRYVTRLMLHIPDATIHTLRELMEPGSEKVFAPYIEQLSGTPRRFFETEFSSKEFDQTKKQVMRRLWGILENQTFERMFSHPRSKLDLFAEMNSGKVILISTAKDLLKEQGSEIFGRFFIALIAQAAQERATLPESKRLPTFVYIDEAADYFDRNIGTILAQARKYNVGMVLAHQYLGQLDARLLDAFAANTSIKLAGGVSAKDARALAPMLQCDPALIEAQPKGNFAGYVRGVTPNAVSLQFPFGYLEKKPVMTPDEQVQLRAVMRERYAVHHSTFNSKAQAPDTPDEAALNPSPEVSGDDVDTAPGDQW